MRKTAEQINRQAEFLSTGIRSETIYINKQYRLMDQSHLYPVCNRFNATERAIKRARALFSQSGMHCAGLDYCYAIENELSRIVNGRL
jgi:hypothetical protein